MFLESALKWVQAVTYYLALVALIVIGGFILMRVMTASPRTSPQHETVSSVTSVILLAPDEKSQAEAMQSIFAKDAISRKVVLTDYRGKMRWLCTNPNCPEGCPEIIRSMGEDELQRLQQAAEVH